MRTLTDSTTGETVQVPEDRVYSYLARRTATGGQRYSSQGGGQMGFFRDPETRELTRRFYSDSELFERGNLAPEDSNVEVQGDVRTREANTNAVRQGRRAVAADSAGTAFLQNAGNTASFGLLGVAERAMLGEEAGEAAEMLEDENPVASGLGTLTGLGATLMAPGGVARALGSAERISARGILGFSERVGGAVTERLGGGRAARFLGNRAQSLAADVPLSIQYNAAHLTDSNRGFSAEAFASAVGTDVLWGAGLDLAIPVAGQALRAASNFTPAGLADGFLRRASRNPASRFMHRGRLTTAARESAEAAVDAGHAIPSRVAAGGADDAFRRTVARAEAMEMPGVARLARNPDEALGLIRRAPAVAEDLVSVAARETPALEGALAGRVSEALPASGYRRGSGMQIAGSLHDLGERLALTGGSDEALAAVAALRDSHALATNGGRANAAALFDLRADLRALEPSSAAVATAAFDDVVSPLLRDPTAWGEGISTAHEALLGLVDDLGHLDIGDIAVEAPSLVDAIGGADGPRARMVSFSDGLDAAVTRAGASGLTVPRPLMGASRSIRESLTSAAAPLEAAEALSQIASRVETAAPRSMGLTEVLRTGADHVASVMASFGANRSFLRHVSDARRAITDFVAQGAPPAVPQIGVFMFREMDPERRRESFERVSQLIDQTAFSADALEGSLSESLESLAVSDPELSDGVGSIATTQMMYLAENLPKAPTDILGRPAYELPQEDIDVFLERFGAIQAPESLLFAVAEGTITEESAEAVRMIYPELFVEMQLQLAEEFADLSLRDDITHVPYVTKLAASTLLGPSIDPTLDASFILELQDDSAQTQEQERTLRGSAASEREPSFAANATTITARLENL